MARSKAVPHVAFYDPLYDQIMSKDTNDMQFGEQKKKVVDFVRYLSICHEAIAERLEDGSTRLSAPNPDDEALVCASSFFGCAFVDRREAGTVLLSVDRGPGLGPAEMRVTVLYSIAFTSSRKRMSVIFKDIDGKVRSNEITLCALCCACL